MTDDAVNPPLAFVDTSPRAIRDALLEEERAAFERQYRQAMAAATDTLDLTGVWDVLRAWRRIVELTEREGVGQRRQTLRRATRIWRNRDGFDRAPMRDMADVLSERMSEDQCRRVAANRERIRRQFEARETLTDSEGRLLGCSEPYTLVPLDELWFDDDREATS